MYEDDVADGPFHNSDQSAPGLFDQVRLASRELNALASTVMGSVRAGFEPKTYVRG